MSYPHRPTRKGIVIGAAALILAFAAGYVGVTNASAQPNDDKAQPASDAAVAALLGRSVPDVHFTSLGLHRSGLAIDPPTAPARGAHLSYAIGSTNVLLLSVRRGELTTTGTPVLIGGRATYVDARSIRDGSTDVSYVWNDAGIGYVLHVNLSNGITRETADTIAGSIR